MTGETIQLTSDGGNDTNPQWSNDGQTIAFFSDRDGNSEIYTLDVATGTETRVTNTAAQERNLAISPDSQWIAFQSDGSGNWEIQVTDMAGADTWVVASDLAADESPTWDCDGAQIVFQSERVGEAELYIVDAFDTAAAPQRLTDSQGENICPAWQPSEEDASLTGMDVLDQANNGLFLMN